MIDREHPGYTRQILFGFGCLPNGYHCRWSKKSSYPIHPHKRSHILPICVVNDRFDQLTWFQFDPNKGGIGNNNVINGGFARTPRWKFVGKLIAKTFVRVSDPGLHKKHRSTRIILGNHAATVDMQPKTQKVTNSSSSANSKAAKELRNSEAGLTSPLCIHSLAILPLFLRPKIFLRTKRRV